MPEETVGGVESTLNNTILLGIWLEMLFIGTFGAMMWEGPFGQ